MGFLNRTTACAGAALVSLIVTFNSTTALAAPIVPGGVQFPAIAEPDPVGATLLFSTGPVNFAAPTFAGTLRSSVFNNDASSPFGPNALTFTYEITNAAGSAHDIARMSVASFGAFLTDASFTPAAGVPPTIITRSADGQVMGFDFVSPRSTPTSPVRGSLCRRTRRRFSRRSRR